MELREALRQITDIRQQMAQSEVFRGYRSLTVGFSGAAAILAAAVQPHVVPSPQDNLSAYLRLWILVAAVSLLVAGGEMFWRSLRAGPGLSRDMTQLAVKQFLPCIVVGALLTGCIYQNAREVAWMLPGLWSLIFGLGVFASYRLLPRQAFWVGVYYIACGYHLLSRPQTDELAAWQMGVSFGGGQLLSAAILYWYVERVDES